jgi:hypothetical protein
MQNNRASELWMRPIRDALKAARVNLVPGLILQTFALGLVLAYYFHAPSRALLEQVSSLKVRYGFLYSAVSTAIFGGLLPFLFLIAQPKTRSHAAFRHLPFLLAFWACKGMEFDLLYRLQALMFGTELRWTVVLPKVLFDQFVYVTVWGGPTMVILLMWKDMDYDTRGLLRLLNRRYYPERILPIVIPNWAVWLPAVAIIYSLPLPLQLPVENLVLCMWVLVMTLLMTPPPGSES